MMEGFLPGLFLHMSRLTIRTSWFRDRKSITDYDSTNQKVI